MRILSWNIQAGGARRESELVAAIERRPGDMLVLTEIRGSSAQFLGALKSKGWNYCARRETVARCGGVAILSRTAFRETSPTPLEPKFPGRWVEVEFPDHELTVVGIYGPLDDEDFDYFWTIALNELKARVGKPTLVTGDLNTGESGADAPQHIKNFFCSHHFQEMKRLGYVDAFRFQHGNKLQHSYSGRRNGYRLDHAMVSPSLLSRLRACEYDDAPRVNRVSDHAPLYVTLARPLAGVAGKRILIPSQGPEDWRRLLAQPDRHWRTGYSAKTLAHTWETANGFPSEVRAVLEESGDPALRNLDALVIIPEYEVALDGGERGSHSDVSHEGEAGWS